jgi:hypothetical protein
MSWANASGHILQIKINHKSFQISLMSGIWQYMQYIEKKVSDVWSQRQNETGEHLLSVLAA